MAIGGASETAATTLYAILILYSSASVFGIFDSGESSSIANG